MVIERRRIIIGLLGFLGIFRVVFIGELAGGADGFVNQGDELFAGDGDFVAAGEFVGGDGAAGQSLRVRLDAVTSAGFEELVDLFAVEEFGAA